MTAAWMRNPFWVGQVWLGRWSWTRQRIEDHVDLLVFPAAAQAVVHGLKAYRCYVIPLPYPRG